LSISENKSFECGTLSDGYDFFGSLTLRDRLRRSLFGERLLERLRDRLSYRPMFMEKCFESSEFLQIFLTG